MTALVWWAAAVTVPVAVAVGVRPVLRRRTARARWRAWRAKAGSASTPRGARDRLRRGLGSPVPTPVGGGLCAAAVGYAVGGPVLAVVLAGYVVAALVLLRRRAVRRELADARRTAVDAVAGLAADLRAGLGVARAIEAAAPALDRAVHSGATAALVALRVGCAVRVAEATGAPLADVLERLDAHLRAADRAQAAAVAQAAGARASAGLLAVLPVAGVGLGTAIGVDPWQVLLRTPAGAGALLLATALQALGLLWSIRLTRVEAAR